MGKLILHRRRLLAQVGACASLLTLGGCDAFDGMLDTDSGVRRFLTKANVLTERAQRALQGQVPMAPEYPASAIRESQRPNGSTDPQSADYVAAQANDFAAYRLAVTGLVERPLSLSLAELQAMPSRK
jgi:DMSO/TMAO reductase YedYZ molybdopterin-dependent catalytic subunit